MFFFFVVWDFGGLASGASFGVLEGKRGKDCMRCICDGGVFLEVLRLCFGLACLVYHGMGVWDGI